MNTLAFLIKRDFKDNLPLWTAPLVLFTMLFALTFFWRKQMIATPAAISVLQVITFLFIFVSATLYGRYLNSVIGTSLQIRTQTSLTRQYLFSLPITRGRLFWLNQARLLLPLFPFITFTTLFIVTFNPISSKITAGGLFGVGLALSWLLLNYFSWIYYLVERTFENRSLTQAFKGFFLINPVLLLVFYYGFLKNIPTLVNGGWNPLFILAFTMPIMMMFLNYRNWLKRE